MSRKVNDNFILQVSAATKECNNNSNFRYTKLTLIKYMHHITVLSDRQIVWQTLPQHPHKNYQVQRQFLPHSHQTTKSVALCTPQILTCIYTIYHFYVLMYINTAVHILTAVYNILNHAIYLFQDLPYFFTFILIVFKFVIPFFNLLNYLELSACLVLSISLLN